MPSPDRLPMHRRRKTPAQGAEIRHLAPSANYTPSAIRSFVRTGFHRKLPGDSFCIEGGGLEGNYAALRDFPHRNPTKDFSCDDLPTKDFGLPGVPPAVARAVGV